MSTNPSVARVCGVTVPDPSLLIGADGALANVVASWDGPPEPGPEKVLPSATVDQKGCLYGPPVLAARVGSHLTLKNSDPLLHNVRALQGERSLFNFAMPLTGMQVTRVLPATPGRVDLHCDVHPWMKGVVWTFAHPHFAVTDERGGFALEGLPPGEQSIRLWHERLGDRMLQVRVPQEGDAVLPDVWFEAPENSGQPGQK